MFLYYTLGQLVTEKKRDLSIFLVLDKWKKNN